MIIHLRFLSVVTLFAIFYAGCSGTKTISTPQTTQAPDIDGNISGWNMQESVIERTEVADYYATHDKEFLYLYIDVKSLSHNQAMKQSGFIIYISNSEENRNRIGLAFPSGTFNLLRENPIVYESFTTDQEWFQQPQNLDRLESLETQIFDRVMVVEQTESDTNYGFIDKEMLQVDGIEISTGDNRRLMSIEMRVPLNSSSIYNLKGNQLWVGFEIDPPNCRIQSNDNNASRQQGYGSRRGRMSQGTNTSRMNLRQRMGQYERWYSINLSQ
jgi:hypothetical protein